MFERFTDRARRTVKGAQHQAQQLGRPFIGTEHLLLALLADDDGMAHDVLTEAGTSYERVRTAVTGIEYTEVDTVDDAAALESIGIDLNAVKAKLEEAFGPGVLDERLPEKRGLFGRRKSAPGVGHLPFTRRSKIVLELSLREALALKHNYIGTQHILLGLIRENGMAAKILADQGIDFKRLRSKLTETTGKE
jgi:ATP-dependent Clp protease ATP-binding subunit ClpA